MNEEYVGGIAVWQFDLAHIQVPLTTLQEDQKITAVISKMTYPEDKLCVVILANGTPVGFPPDFLEADIISTVKLLSDYRDLSTHSMKGRIASKEGGRITVELGLTDSAERNVTGEP